MSWTARQLVVGLFAALPACSLFGGFLVDPITGDAEAPGDAATPDGGVASRRTFCEFADAGPNATASACADFDDGGLQAVCKTNGAVSVVLTDGAPSPPRALNMVWPATYGQARAYCEIRAADLHAAELQFKVSVDTITDGQTLFAVTHQDGTVTVIRITLDPAGGVSPSFYEKCTSDAGGCTTARPDHWARADHPQLVNDAGGSNGFFAVRARLVLDPGRMSLSVSVDGEIWWEGEPLIVDRMASPVTSVELSAGTHYGKGPGTIRVDDFFYAYAAGPDASLSPWK